MAVTALKSSMDWTKCSLDSQEMGEQDSRLADMLCAMILIVAGRRPDSVSRPDGRCRRAREGLLARA